MTKYEKFFKIKLELVMGIHDAQEMEFGDQKEDKISDYLHRLHSYYHGQIDLLRELMAMPDQEPVECSSCECTNRDYGCTKCNPHKRQHND